MIEPNSPPSDLLSQALKLSDSLKTFIKDNGLDADSVLIPEAQSQTKIQCLLIDAMMFPAPPAKEATAEYGDAYQGDREDLAIWKRRALEAEERIRQLEQINDHLVKEAQGEHRMGEPVIIRGE